MILVIIMETAKQKERELIIKLSKEKKSCRQIAAILGVSKSKAAYWISRFNKTSNLADKHRDGRPTPLTNKTLNHIADAIRLQILQPRNKVGISSKEVLQLIEHKTCKKYTLRHIQRILHKLGFSLVTPRVAHIRKDEGAQNKFRAEFKKNLRKNMWIIPS